jgi:NAD(P)-dependent dehydrogenase (short-subunit alcohol dehydrogenase family)
MDEFPLALVTGAAHRLGRAFALTLARHGYAILLHYHHSVQAAAATADEIRAIGAPAYLMEADLTDATQIRSLFSYIDSLNLHLKILVNSAAGMIRADLHTISIEDWDATLNLNLRAPLLLAQYSSERMLQGGLIVNVTDAGFGKVWSGFPAYIVSKAGLETLTRIQAKTYAPNIRVNAIAPGLVLSSRNMRVDEWDKLVSRLPLKRSTSVEEITLALEYLLKNESVTGQTLMVDSGYSLI